jgi:hypothetical protein
MPAATTWAADPTRVIDQQARPTSDAAYVDLEQVTIA